MSNIIGNLVLQAEDYTAFVPHSFPPVEGFDLNPGTFNLAQEATRLLGKLDGITKLLPDADFFLLMYLRKDAASSSQIEGTQATMIDAIEAEVVGREDRPTDVDDILHYIKALDYGRKRMTDDKFPLSLRLIRELHQQLMDNARGTHFPDPGNFRRTQNWIGGTRPGNAKFVPPPPNEIMRALGDLEAYMHLIDPTPIVVKSGIIHAQFETIHPFLDGNGRTGRMLITFYLWSQGYLEKPVLFLSSYFRKHQQEYYNMLTAYHNGRVDEWVTFYLEGVIEIANEAIVTVDKITKLRNRDMVKIQSLGKRAAESAMVVLPRLYAQPIVTSAELQKWTGFTRAGAKTLIDRFIKMGILEARDLTRKYAQSYVYRDYVSIFTEG